MSLAVGEADTELDQVKLNKKKTDKGVVKTTSSHQTGSRVTVMELLDYWERILIRKMMSQSEVLS